MEFLRMVRDKEGPFKLARFTSAPTMNSLDRMDLFLVMECLDEPGGEGGETLCAEGRQRVRSMLAMSEDRMRDHVCSTLEVDPAAPLETVFGVSSLQDLLNHASWRRTIQKHQRNTTMRQVSSQTDRSESAASDVHFI